jgi:hypothetical protein
MCPLPAGLEQRLYISDLMTLYRVSRATIYRHIERGVIPQPDGKDQTRPYWLVSTIKATQPGKASAIDCNEPGASHE